MTYADHSAPSLPTSRGEVNTAHRTIWLVSRGEEPGAIPCDSESTARAYARARWIEDEYNGAEEEAQGLSWDEYGELLDAAIPDTFQGTGWTVCEERVLQASDIEWGTQ